ncbi:protein kinase [Streptomyces sp. NPDC091272]|uniref:protein kinase n=1 Tax=Streptomyces sp. NPDC091272 TaxID=3365981 RepID=UPI00382827B0
MDDYAGRVLADRYRLPLPPSDEYDLVETRAFDGYSGQEVLVRQVPLPEVVDAEFVDGEGGPLHRRPAGGRGAPRRSGDPAVRRAIDAAQAAAQVPDHPRLDQVFDVFEEDGSLWIVSELVAARPLAALLAEAPLSPYRAAEVASDVLTALRVLHAHGWTHRNITARTVLVCDDGRIVLTGLAAGAAEEALCGYAPIPGAAAGSAQALPAGPQGGPAGGWGETSVPVPRGHVAPGGPGAGQPALPALPTDFLGRPAGDPDPGGSDPGAGPAAGAPSLPAAPAAGDARAARAGAIAAYRAGARAAARATEEQRRQSADPPRGQYLQDPAQGPGTGTRTSTGTDAGSGTGTGTDTDTGTRAVSPYGAAAAGTGPVSPYGDPQERTPRPGATSPYGNRPPGGGHDATTGQRPAAVAPYGRGERAERADPAERGGRGNPGEGVERVTGQGPGAAWHGAVPRGGGAGGEALRADELRHSHRPEAGPPQGQGFIPGQGERQGERQAQRHAERQGFVPGQGERHGERQAERQGHARGPGQELDRVHAPQGAGSGHLPSTVPAPAKAAGGSGRWDEVIAGLPYRGPSTPLAAERARQTRIAVVGAVTERWAPEQAGPVYENWQLAPPIGPATDLWALGALLFRVVQGHAPYPEDNTAELVQMVCAEPPAFAEECGPLRPVVESLLRQDPTERPDFEELRGWLRSLVRSAPEPDAGTKVVPLPSPPDDTRLPIVRRRGELVRRRRGASQHGRHRHKQGKASREREPRAPRVQREPRIGARQPRSMGRWLLLLVLAGLAAAVVYAVMFLPEGASEDPGQNTGSGQPAQSGGAQSDEPQQPAPENSEGPPAEGSDAGQDDGANEGQGQDKPPAADPPPAQNPASGLPSGYVLRKDEGGFQIAVDKNWRRTPMNSNRQVRYQGYDIEIVVVPGRDTVKAKGSDPMVYQLQEEQELQPLRDSTWAQQSGLRRISVGQQAAAEGQFTWKDSSGRDVFVRNKAMIVGGTYHVIQVIGPESQRDEVSEVYEAAVLHYRSTK